MKTIARAAIRTGFLALLGLLLGLPVLAGTAEDESAPADAVADWQATVERLMAAPKSGLSQNAHRAALIDRAWARGTVPVIVRFKESESDAAAPQDEVQSARALKRQDVLARLGLGVGLDRAGQQVKTFSHLDGLALRADASDIGALLDDPDVLDVVEDIAYPPALLESVPLIGAVGGAFGVYTGQGQAVAILDTGVDKTHSLLPGKVISEACYSTNSPVSGVYSLCPGSAAASTATGSGVNCDPNLWGSACSHGTHVAGIVAGNNNLYTGVARDAKLIAIQVFSGFSATYCGTGSACVMAFTSDIIKGLERVYALRGTYPIASVNLSLGGGYYSSACDDDPTKPAIDNLRTAGIATMVASGNSGYTDALSAPACVSSAISVGAICDAAGSYCQAQDAVAGYSNSASFLSLLAPGSAIASSVPGGGYATWHGTSMAAPHVAGAWAVLKQARPAAGVDEILAALKATGKPVIDARNGIAIPRIQPAAAIESLNQVLPPAAPTVAPATGVTGSGFFANWGSVAGAGGYRLDVSTSSAFASFVSGYRDLDVGAAASKAVSGLSAGTTYYYRVRAYNVGGVSASSGIQPATTAVAVPGAPVLVAATKLSKTGFQANWTATAGATGYRLDVATNSTFSALLSGYSNLDVGNVLSRSVTGLKSNTSYYVRLRAYNAAGASASSRTLTVKTLK